MSIHRRHCQGTQIRLQWDNSPMGPRTGHAHCTTRGSNPAEQIHPRKTLLNFVTVKARAGPAKRAFHTARRSADDITWSGNKRPSSLNPLRQRSPSTVHASAQKTGENWGSHARKGPPAGPGQEKVRLRRWALPDWEKNTEEFFSFVSIFFSIQWVTRI